MSHDAFVQACCAISDVDNPRPWGFPWETSQTPMVKPWWPVTQTGKKRRRNPFSDAPWKSRWFLLRLIRHIQKWRFPFQSSLKTVGLACFGNLNWLVSLLLKLDPIFFANCDFFRGLFQGCWTWSLWEASCWALPNVWRTLGTPAVILLTSRLADGPLVIFHSKLEVMVHWIDLIYSLLGMFNFCGKIQIFQRSKLFSSRLQDIRIYSLDWSTRIRELLSFATVEAVIVGQICWVRSAYLVVKQGSVCIVWGLALLMLGQWKILGVSNFESKLINTKRKLLLK